MTGRLHHEPVGDALVPLSGRRELVEDVVVSLLAGLEGDPGLLQQVVLDHATLDLELRVEADLRESTQCCYQGCLLIITSCNYYDQPA